MPFKTPSKNSDYIRGMIKPERDPYVAGMLRRADGAMIPSLLPESAVFLEQLVMLKKPDKTLEIGTAAGYSAQLILRNCGGTLTTVEINENLAAEAKRNLDALGYGGRYTIFIGDAGEILPYMDGEYDFIFMDGPKTHYLEYLTHLKRMLKKGGVLLADNVLFNGMITGEGEAVRSKRTIIEAIEAYLSALRDDEDFISGILPVGDGMSLAIRIK